MRFFSELLLESVSFISKDKCGKRIDQSKGPILPFFALISLFLMLAPPTGNAGYITMSPELKAIVDEPTKMVRLSGSVTNRGDESAKEVSLEFPTLNRRIKVSELMAVNTPSAVKVEIPFQELGIEKKGQYTLAYRVLYHDMNMYPFSNVQLLELVLGTVPARSLRMAFDLDGKNALTLQSDVESEIQIESIAEQDVSIEKVLLVSPIEVSSTIENEAPQLLKPGQKKKLEFEIQNKSALPGSNYYFAALASGTLGDLHFSEVVATNIVIEKPIEKRRKFVLYGLAGLGVALAIMGSLTAEKKVVRHKSDDI
jgi:hypothetical protein